MYNPDGHVSASLHVLTCYLCAQVLLGGYRVDINGENCPNSASPLQIAVEQKDLELVKVLKHAGANAELARLTVATKLQQLKRNSGSSPGAASSSSNTEASPSNGYLRTPEQTVPARMSHASPATPFSDHASSAEPKGKRSNPSSPFQLSQPSPVPEIQAASEEDVKGKRSLWPPPTPVTRAGVPPSGDKRSLSRHARRGSSDSLSAAKQEQHESDQKLDNHGSEGRRKFGYERRDSAEDLRRANSNMGRLSSSRSTDMLLASV